MVTIIISVQTGPITQEIYTENNNQSFIPIKIKKKNDTFISGRKYVYIFNNKLNFEILTSIYILMI